MTFQVGDALALAKLAVDIYQNVFLVAKAAPEAFTKLLRELIVVKNVLYNLHRRYQRANRHYFDDATSAALAGCEDALRIFQPIVIKYKNLASANGSQLRQKLKFPFDQKKIHAARDDLQRSIATLNLALAADAAVSDTTDDSTATRRPHRSKQPTVERVEDATPVSPGHGPDSRLLQEGPSERASNAQEYPWRLGRAETIDTTTAEALGSRRREDTVTSIPETHLAPVAQESRHAGSRHSADSLRSHHTKSSFASSGSAAVGTPLTIVPASPRDSIFPKEYSLSTARTTPAEGDEPSIHESEEQVPIDAEYRTEIEERLAEHKLFKEQLSPIFSKEAESMKKQNLSLDRWLSCAMWWLLKARKTTNAIQSAQRPLEQGRTGWPHRISLQQSTVDMFKACWICTEVVFASQNATHTVSSSTWKSAKDLASALYDELYFYDIRHGLDEGTNIGKLYTSFTEKPHQPIEHQDRLPAALDSLRDATAWLTVDIDHAGEPNERVLLRTFVNAQIGTDPRTRRKSGSAPYMLLLWSQHGRSEVLVSLANQFGTVHLCTTLTQQDLTRHEEHTKSPLEFELSFPSQDSVVQFINPQELQDFVKQPRDFFKATRERESRPEEFLCFREGLQSFDERTHRPRTSITGHTSITQAHSSCEVSLYQHIPDQCWKTQRRLVVSSALDATQPWCYSYWLPVSHVRVQGQGRDVELYWSDCNQLEQRNDGNYGTYWSLIYSPSSPNIKVSMRFQTSANADEFKAAILRPWNIPFESDYLECKGTFQAAGGPDNSPDSAPVGQELSVWRLMDAHDAGKLMYLSIVHVERNAQLGFEASVYFVHRDVDFLIERTGPRSVSFEGLWVPRYLSNINEVKAAPKVRGVCEDVDWALSSANFFFEVGELARFMHSLIGWELVFCCKAASIATGTAIKATRQNDAIVALWKRPGDPSASRDLRLTSRWLGEVHGKGDFKWTTATISMSSACTINSAKLLIKDVHLSRGTELDIKFLKAVSAQVQAEEQRNRNIAIAFPEASAAQRMNSVISQIFHPTHFNQDQDPALWRPMTYITDTSTSQRSSNEASKFLQRM